MMSEGWERDAARTKMRPSGDDSHEDARSFAEGKRLELYERLRGVERKGRVEVQDAEQENDGRDEPSMLVAIVLVMIPRAASTPFNWGKNNQDEEVARPVNGNDNPLCMLRLFGDVA